MPAILTRSICLAARSTGTPQTFELGPASAEDSVPNAVKVTSSATILLPQGNYTEYPVPGHRHPAGGNPTSATFYVDYVNCA